VDRSPAEVVATLLDERTWICSERTMYRILAESAESRERRNVARHPQYSKPELLATGPNQIWSWDITKLRGPAKWSWYYLYVILDIFSRYVTGWMVAERESAIHGQRLIEETIHKYGIVPGQLSIHSDRGNPMVAKTTAQLYADLGVERSLSRPHTSNDNPYSESMFKTAKYHPRFPGRFESPAEAVSYCRSFFPWYNEEHRHGGIAHLTPAMVHFGQADQVVRARQAVLDAAYDQHPERFVHQAPTARSLPAEVWINRPMPPASEEEGQ
jgi:putative transposase